MVSYTIGPMWSVWLRSACAERLMQHAHVNSNERSQTYNHDLTSTMFAVAIVLCTSLAEYHKHSPCVCSV